jgi:hypothetical protein
MQNPWAWRETRFCRCTPRTCGVVAIRFERTSNRGAHIPAIRHSFRAPPERSIVHAGGLSSGGPDPLAGHRLGIDPLVASGHRGCTRISVSRQVTR